MKLAKRLLALSLAVMMVLSFVGCDNKDKGNDGEIVTLRMLMGFANQPDTDMVLAEANKIAEKEIGARLDIEWIDGAAYSQQMKMNMPHSLSDVFAAVVYNSVACLCKSQILCNFCCCFKNLCNYGRILAIDFVCR